LADQLDDEVLVVQFVIVVIGIVCFLVGAQNLDILWLGLDGDVLRVEKSGLRLERAHTYDVQLVVATRKLLCHIEHVDEGLVLQQFNLPRELVLVICFELELVGARLFVAAFSYHEAVFLHQYQVLIFILDNSLELSLRWQDVCLNELIPIVVIR